MARLVYVPVPAAQSDRDLATGRSDGYIVKRYIPQGGEDGSRTHMNSRQVAHNSLRSELLMRLNTQINRTVGTMHSSRIEQSVYQDQLVVLKAKKSSGKTKKLLEVARRFRGRHPGRSTYAQADE
jgi:hypothetical protein